MSALDTSAEAVEAICTELRDFHGADGRQAAALLRALLRERDEARAQSRMWQEACGEHGGRYWEARCRDAEAARDTAEAVLATARADALREAAARFNARDWPAYGNVVRHEIEALISQEPRA